MTDLPRLEHPYPIPEAGIKDDAVTVDKIADGEITNAKIAALAAIAYSKLATDPRIVRIKTGTYTGDGSTSQAIEGIGFQPKLLLIQEKETSSAQYSQLYIATEAHQTGMITRTMISGTTCCRSKDNAVDTLDVDGFTVDDGGNDLDPNKDGVTYWYVAMG